MERPRGVEAGVSEAAPAACACACHLARRGELWSFVRAGSARTACALVMCLVMHVVGHAPGGACHAPGGAHAPAARHAHAPAARRVTGHAPTALVIIFYARLSKFASGGLPVQLYSLQSVVDAAPALSKAVSQLLYL